MRYWALATGMIGERGGQLHPTALGRFLLDDDGADPFVEAAATVWLAHWGVASTPNFTTTTYFAFNLFQGLEFYPSDLAAEILALAEARGWRASATTIKRDVEVFLRGYVRRTEGSLEDAAEPLLAELGLVREVRGGGYYEFVRGPKPSLPDAVFAFALHEFWQSTAPSAATLSAEQVAYLPGSPGRVFKLDDDSVAMRLMAMDAVTDGALRWTDTAGLRQIQRNRDFAPLDLLPGAYARATSRIAA
jgi:hypothetical protein